jgi:hypothetical protein
VQENLNVLFGLDFICTEFPLDGLRIDSLAFDQESQAFVIIEYMSGHSYFVVNQCYSDLSLLLNNKAALCWSNFIVLIYSLD